MRKLILHIGRHKTGTTAIQHFLGDNRDALEACGYYVPLTGRLNAGHHGLSHPLRPRDIAANPAADVAELPVFRKLRGELGDVPGDQTIVISSEAFQNCRPEIVQQAFREYDTGIVVYLRNQLEYLASAYVQRVHATDYAGTLEDFYRDVYQSGSNYHAFLSGWERCFDRPLIVRRYPYSRSVEDFCSSALKLDAGNFRRRDGASNPSLNARITAFKRELNRRALPDAPTREQMYFVLPELNGRFPADKFALPEHISSDLMASCGDTDRATARRYFGEDELFDYSRYAARPEPEISEQEYEQIYAELRAQIAAREAEKAAARTPGR
jgi:hypothetical protein